MAQLSINIHDVASVQTSTREHRSADGSVYFISTDFVFTDKDGNEYSVTAFSDSRLKVEMN